ncbi:MAG: polysaccharide deacetylase family protein [Solirubrobacteraceae bacterium]
MPSRLTLCYHGLSPSWPAVISATPSRFERQVASLLRRGYRPVRFSEIVAASGAEKLLAITFDDAFRSVVQYGLPILERLGAVATLFVPTDYIDAGRPMRWSGIEEWLGGPHENELLPASWAQLRALAEAGWEIGSHTCSHPHLTAIDGETLARELSQSRAVCEERMSAPCTSIA